MSRPVDIRTNCCGESFIGETDICRKCEEHAEVEKDECSNCVDCGHEEETHCDGWCAGGENCDCKEFKPISPDLRKKSFGIGGRQR